MIFTKTLTKTIQAIKKDALKPAVLLFTTNFLVVVFQLVYLNLRFSYLNEQIPLWYTKPWGELQLGIRNDIFIIPTTSILITLAGVAFLLFVRKEYFRYGQNIIFFVVSFSNFLLTYSLFRIVSIASVPFPPLVNPAILSLAIPFLASLGLAYYLTPRFIAFAKKNGIVTDPTHHIHPAMILTRPSARGGGIVFVATMALSALIFIAPVTTPITGILTVAGLLAVLGLLDDYQNTHPKTFLRFLEKPNLRLILMFLIASLIIFFGVQIEFINNPFNGSVDLGGHATEVGGIQIEPFSAILTVVWIVWILNLLSWSNGIDGQYSGIIGVTALVIAVLALRFEPLRPEHTQYATLAVITAGASFGLTPYTWHPSKIMWGFGAIAAGFSIAVLSILINSKITTSIMILLIPFLDALVTIVRRIAQKKSPLKGDRGHLHHLLLERGWSKQKIAMFYWLTTMVFGIIAIISAEKLNVQTALTFSGVVAFFIVLMNLKVLGGKPRLQETGK